MSKETKSCDYINCDHYECENCHIEDLLLQISETSFQKAELLFSERIKKFIEEQDEDPDYSEFCSGYHMALMHFKEYLREMGYDL